MVFKILKKTTFLLHVNNVDKKKCWLNIDIHVDKILDGKSVYVMGIVCW